MKKLNRKGFTLVELIAVITLLGIVATIGGITITKNMNNAKEKQYTLLIKNVKRAVETYYMECKYGYAVGDEPTYCTDNSVDTEYTINASVLINNGFITPNFVYDNPDTPVVEKENILLNPDTEDTKICTIKYKYNSTTDEIEIDEVTGIIEANLKTSGC